jgi:hypothetical protein
VDGDSTGFSGDSLVADAATVSSSVEAGADADSSSSSSSIISDLGSAHQFDIITGEWRYKNHVPSP